MSDNRKSGKDKLREHRGKDRPPVKSWMNSENVAGMRVVAHRFGVRVTPLGNQPATPYHKGGGKVVQWPAQTYVQIEGGTGSKTDLYQAGKAARRHMKKLMRKQQ